MTPTPASGGEMSEPRSVLDALDAAEKAATEGPWTISDPEKDKGVTYCHVYTSIEDVEALWQIPADAELIALSRNHLRALIEAGDALRRIAYNDPPPEAESWLSGKSWRIELAKARVAPLLQNADR